ncbi:MAG: hypothetical protein JOZ62_05825, partial [Acidobacteriaceae bacterium]|nr:hypothetical protein [Acidobacteriaceae bacterium]
LYWNARVVYVDPSRKSRFIESYDPRLGVEQFGRIWESSASGGNAAGRHGVWNSREIRIRVAVDESQVSVLIGAMQRNVRDTLTRVGSRCLGFGSSGIEKETAYRTRYEDSNTSGVIIIGPTCRAYGPVYRDPSRADRSSTFLVPIWIEEQWAPN